MHRTFPMCFLCFCRLLSASVDKSRGCWLGLGFQATKSNSIELVALHPLDVLSVSICAIKHSESTGCPVRWCASVG